METRLSGRRGCSAGVVRELLSGWSVLFWSGLGFAYVVAVVSRLPGAWAAARAASADPLCPSDISPASGEPLEASFGRFPRDRGKA